VQGRSGARSLGSNSGGQLTEEEVTGPAQVGECGRTVNLDPEQDGIACCREYYTMYRTEMLMRVLASSSKDRCPPEIVHRHDRVLEDSPAAPAPLALASEDGLLWRWPPSCSRARLSSTIRCHSSSHYRIIKLSTEEKHIPVSQ
jgi:hypothetical protein